MDDKREFIDVHCHLFTAQYGIMELAAATWNNLHGDYPHRKVRVVERTMKRGSTKTLPGLDGFISWVANLLAVSLNTPEGNYHALEKAFGLAEADTERSLVVMPLMVDSYFAFHDNREEFTGSGKTRTIINRFVLNPAFEKEFDAHFADMQRQITAEFDNLSGKQVRTKADTSKLEAAFATAHRELVNIAFRSKAAREYEGIELSPGYEKHMHDLERLAARYPGQVFPFLAVDPRRKGILELIKLKVAEGKGVFKGIKLYPPMGYLPTHPKLRPILEYCAEHDIPIITHASPGGIQNSCTKLFVSDSSGKDRWENFVVYRGNKRAFFADPLRWQPILEDMPTLRINFAHAGGSDQLLDEKMEIIRGLPPWLAKIIGFMNSYPNVYADLSHYTERLALEKMLEYVDRHPIMNSRLMFGTDFVMILMDKKLGKTERYFDNFSMFNEKILSANARDFIKI